MGLADVHQYHPSKQAFENSDLILMIGARLDNQMNFGNPPLFPASTTLVCINGSHEEIIFNRSADICLLSCPGAFLEAMLEMGTSQNWQADKNWFDTNRELRGLWVQKMLTDLEKEVSAPEFNGRIHPLQLALDVQSAMGDNDWLVIDGGNTHFWSEIAINMAGWQGKKLAGILHPGTFSLLGVGASFAVSAKNIYPNSSVVLISGDGAFLSGGFSVEAAFQEKRPIVVVIDNNGDSIAYLSSKNDYLRMVRILPRILETYLITNYLRALVVMENWLHGVEILSRRFNELLRAVKLPVSM